MGKIAFLFPGQASQYSGMGREIYERFPTAKAVFDNADAAVGFPLSKLCFEGSEDDLKLTENTQPAILAVSVAVYRLLTERDTMPDYVAGHSLGEYSALVAADSLEFADAVRLVRNRGRYMQEAVPAGEGGMAAILGLAPGLVVEICKRAADGEVLGPANLNAPQQTVVSGSAVAVKRAVELASQSGAKRAVLLPVSAPFHCELMKPAEKRLEADLQRTKFCDLKFPLVTNVDAEAITSGEEARAALVRQVCQPVRWEESVREMIRLGVTFFLEVGPGRVLSGLVRQIDRSVRVANAEDEESLTAALEKLARERTADGEAEAEAEA
jgi:[acyl-carrier-protein] S-malonyltransferase